MDLDRRRPPKPSAADLDAQRRERLTALLCQHGGQGLVLAGPPGVAPRRPNHGPTATETT